MKKIKRVFIFAHCDDELFCLPLLLEKESDNVLVYLTTLNKSQTVEHQQNVRQLEALKAFRYLNKLIPVKTHFYGSEIYDGFIHDSFDEVDFTELTRLVLDEKPDELITLSYEAGHQDHDSVYFITRLISENNRIIFRCFSGYRASGLSPKSFSVLKPFSTSGTLAFNRISVVLTALRLMMIYKSQVKTWFGLAPALLFKYSFFPFRETKYENLLKTQHIEKCFYEIRGRAKQHDVMNSHQKFISQFNSKRG